MAEFEGLGDLDDAAMARKTAMRNAQSEWEHPSMSGPEASYAAERKAAGAGNDQVSQILGEMVNTKEMSDALKGYVTQGDTSRWAEQPKHLVVVHVTHSNLKLKQIEMKLDRHATIFDVKSRLHLHCGTPPMSQRLQLQESDGTAICMMDDDNKMLGFYSPDHGMNIHVIDTDPNSISAGGALEDVSLVERYRMSEETYQ